MGNLFFSFPFFNFAHAQSLQAIYNFPDLLPDNPKKITSNQILKLVERDYRIITNDDFYNLYRAGITDPILKEAIENIYLNQYYFSRDDFLKWAPLEYNIKRKRLLYSIREELNAEHADGKLNLGFRFRNIETHMNLSGYQNLLLKYGHSFDIKRKRAGTVDTYLTPNNFEQNRRFFAGSGDESLISPGFNVDQNLNIFLKGQVGRKIEVELNYNSRSKENNYRVEYVGDEREVISSIRFGQVDLNVGGKSKFITTGGTTKQAFGIRVEGKKNNFDFTSVLGITRGVSDVYTMRGGNVYIKDIDYIRNRFFELPDTNVVYVEGSLYRQISDDNRETAPLVIQTQLINSSSNTLLFELVDRDKYKVVYKNGRVKLDLEGVKVGVNDYTLFFYKIKYNDGGNFFPGAASNVNVFIGNVNYDSESIPLTGPVGLAMLHVADNVLNDDNLIHSYQIRNHYHITRELDLTSLEGAIVDSRGDLLDEHVWRGTREHVFEQAGRVFLNQEEGYFYFEENNPFTNYSNYGGLEDRGVYEIKTPTLEYHQASIAMQFDAEEIDFIDLGRFNIIRGSVMVARGGRVIDPNEYRVNYFNGKIYFSQKQRLLKGEVIEVHYEYQPFGSSLQKLLVASRVDYVLRHNSYIGSTLAYTRGQETEMAPKLGFEVGQQLVMGLDTHLELISLFQRRRYTDYSINVDAEWAFSLYDKNHKDIASIDDLEEQQSISLPKSFLNYYLSANPYLENSRILGRSYFVDFSRYSISGEWAPEEFTLDTEIAMLNNRQNTSFSKRQDVNFRPYEVRPGPFQVVGEGHLSPREYPYQSSLVFDFDFSHESTDGHSNTQLGYVSFVAPVGLSRSVDFTKFHTIEVIYKLLPKYDLASRQIKSNPNVIGFSLDIGRLSEDLDLDNFADRENSQVEVDGFSFNYARNGYVNRTQIGAGYKGFNSSNEIAIGNNILDKEDRNGDGFFILANQEEVETFPNNNTVTSNGNADFFYLFSQSYIDSNTIIKDMIENKWSSNGVFYERLANASPSSKDVYQKTPYYKMTIPLKQLTNKHLQSVNYIRLNLIELNNLEKFGTLNKQGRLIVESIRFKGDVWSRPLVDGYLVNNPKQFSASTLSTLDDSDYQENHLARFFRREYEEIHGIKLEREFSSLIESAMIVDYRLSGVHANGVEDSENGRFGLIEKRETSPEGKDLSFYKAIKFYLFMREKENSENADLVYRFGRDEFNYYELRIPMNNIENNRAWKEYTIRFKARDPVKKNDFASKLDSDHVFLLEFREKMNKSDTRSSSFSDSDGPVEIPRENYTIRSIGFPNLKQVSYWALGVENQSTGVDGGFPSAEGSFLINELAAIDDEWLFGQAYRMGIGFKKNKSISYNNLNILSDLEANAVYQHEGVNFNSIDLPLNVGHKESFSANAGFALFDMFELKGGYLKDYYLADGKDELLNRENQSLNIVDNGYASIAFGLPKDYGLAAKLVPNITGTYNNNLSTLVGLDPISTNVIISNANEREVVIVQNVDLIEDYSLSVDKPYQFTKDIALIISYGLKTSISRKDVLTNRKNLGGVFFLDESVKEKRQGFFIVSKNEHRDVNPILANFPSPRAKLFDKRDNLRQISYDYVQDHSVDVGITLWDFKFDFGYDLKYNYNYRLTNEQQFQTDIAFKLNQDHFDNPWYYHTNSEYQNKSISYRFRFGYGRAIPLYFVTLKKLNASITYRYLENNFQYETTKNINISDLILIDGVSLSRASNIQNYFASPRDYRDIVNRFSWNIDFPLTLLNFRKTPFLFSGLSRLNLSRDVNYTEYQVLNEVLPDALIDGTSKDQIGIYGQGQSVQYGFIKTLEKNYIEKTVDLVLGARMPYWKFPLLEDLIHIIATIIDKDNYLKGWLIRDAYRIKISEDIDKIVDYKIRAGSTNENDRINKIVAHDGYKTEATLIDRFSFALDFHSYKNTWGYILPDVFDYSTQLETVKRDGEIYQNEKVNFSLRKNFNKLNKLVTKAMPSGNGFRRQFIFNSLYTYSENKNYRTKDILRTHGLKFSASFIRLTKRVDFSMNYIGTYNEDYQAYRLYTDGNYFENIPYMGIGSFAGRKVISSYADNSTYLNYGQNERYYYINKVEQIGNERSDVVYFNHDIIFNFNFRQGERVVIRLGEKSLNLPASKNQLLRILFNFKDFILPGVDTGLFERGLFLPSHQNNILGVKNLYNYRNASALNGDLQLWATKASYENTFSLDKNNNFTLTYGWGLALVGVASADSYAGYRNENRTGEEGDNIYSSTDPEFTRRTDYVQLGFEIFLRGAIRF